MLDDYLEQRARDPSFVMVELGHGRYPMVGQQPHDFTGQQAYIGIETGMRDDSSDEYWDGEFDPATILPDGAADEVVASNVFCDPLIGMEWAYTKRMLGETARLVADNGVIVLRETITPWKVVWMDDKTLAEAGLETVERIRPEDTTEWENLEQVYGTHSGIIEYNPYPSAYYLFLAKAAR